MTTNTPPTTAEQLREQILNLVVQYAEAQWQEPEFVPGEMPVRVSGRVFDADDVTTLVDSALDFWLTAGRLCNPVRARTGTVHGDAQCATRQQR
jgi:CDP-6-deoxy-D-xylo-4-hexulose-3-dehydrase